MTHDLAKSNEAQVYVGIFQYKWIKLAIYRIIPQWNGPYHYPGIKVPDGLGIAWGHPIFWGQYSICLDWATALRSRTQAKAKIPSTI